MFNVNDVARLIGLSRATIYALIKDDLFPPPRRVGKRSVRWTKEDIEEWIKSRPRTR